MSMHYDGEHGYGMYINMDEAAVFWKNYLRMHPEELDSYDEEDAENGICDHFDCSIINDNNYDCRDIYSLGKNMEFDFDESAEGVFFYSIKQGDIFGREDRCYKDIDEMINEFKKWLGKYLPEDFDYEGHMAHFSGAAFG